MTRRKRSPCPATQGWPDLQVPPPAFRPVHLPQLLARPSEPTTHTMSKNTRAVPRREASEWVVSRAVWSASQPWSALAHSADALEGIDRITSFDLAADQLVVARIAADHLRNG